MKKGNIVHAAPNAMSGDTFQSGGPQEMIPGMILYELAKRFEERARIRERLRRTDDEEEQIQALREEMASLELRLYEQARQWLNGVQLSAVLPAEVPSGLAMLPGVQEPSMLTTRDTQDFLALYDDDEPDSAHIVL
jgi:hypothetical protein